MKTPNIIGFVVQIVVCLIVCCISIYYASTESKLDPLLPLMFVFSALVLCNALVDLKRKLK